MGVARQWCGRLGKVENCQVGVFAAYASRLGCTLLDRRLYLPDEWFDEDHRPLWEGCGIPDEVTFKTKPQLALEMLKAMVKGGSLHFHWVACDEAFGRDTAFLDAVADLDLWYFAEAPCDTRVWQLPSLLAACSKGEEAPASPQEATTPPPPPEAGRGRGS